MNPSDGRPDAVPAKRPIGRESGGASSRSRHFRVIRASFSLRPAWVTVRTPNADWLANVAYEVKLSPLPAPQWDAYLDAFPDTPQESTGQHDRRKGKSLLRTVVADILDALDGGRVLWAGSMPPRHDMALGGALYDPQADFRLPAAMHQSFDAVFLVERDLARLKQWPLILDEALRAVSPGGVIVIRLKETAFLSIFHLANFLEKWTDGAYETLDQVVDAGHYVLSLRLNHSSLRPMGTESVSFTLVTDGRKPDSVRAFVESVIGIRGRSEAKTEILVCGPASVLTDLGALANEVRLVDQPDNFGSRGWITRKKNMLVAASTCETIIVAHDRYVLPTDFFEKLRSFGGDFDVIVPAQKTQDGMAMPDWVMVGDDLSWSVPGWMDYGDYHPYAYVNGGVLIARTSRLRQTRWSELLFWGQAEDIDLSRRLADRGVTPRLARHIQLVSERPRAGFVEGFERIPWNDNLYPQTDRPDSGLSGILGPVGTSLKPTNGFRIEDDLDLAGPKAVALAVSRGLVLHRQWQPCETGVTWSADGDPSLSLKLLGRQSQPTVSLLFASPEQSANVQSVLINGTSCPLWRGDGGRLEVPATEHTLRFGNVLHIQIQRSTATPVTLSAFCVTNAPIYAGHDLRSTISLAHGSPQLAWLSGPWNPADAEGAWTCGKVAELIVPVLRPPRGRLRGQVNLTADFPPGALDQSAVILVDDKVVGRWTLTCEQPVVSAKFKLPRRTGDRIRITFRSSRLSPGGTGPQSRLRGVGVRSVIITDGSL